MLQRAASNAYTWWWASNIRSKQSKWLDNDLQEMEERVKSMVKLIEEDGDSFAKKAEMYYKRRPELISRVEETFKAYKALADRYDRISGELHKANHTIATVLPDQVQFMEDEDDDRPPPKEMPSANSNKFMSMSPPPDSIKLPKPPPPDLPRMLPRGLASDPQQATKKMHHVRVASFQEIPENVKEEIDKLHKGILILQTEKEFFKGMYERGLTKYWDIERQMTEMQEEVTRLQDEFGASNMIEDDEARALIAATALKSCEDTLITLREQQKRTVEEARLESKRIKEASHKLNALKGGEGGGEEGSEDAADRHVSSGSSAVEEEIESLKNERLELQSVCAKVKEHFELCSDSSVVELAEKIDELVDKVISLEVIVSSLTAQIERLRSETDELHKYLRGLEEEKASPAWDSDSMNDRLKQAEQDLQRIQKLERSVHQDKRVLRIQLCQVCHSLNDLSEKLQSPRQTEKPSAAEDDDDDDEAKRSNLDVENVDKTQGGEKKLIKSQECLTEEGEGDRDWERLLMNGFEGNEKVLLLKCASIIRNYKETKMMLTEIDKKNQECHSETMQQIQELRNANAVKDEEIRALRQRLFSSESWRARGSSMKKAAAPQHVQKLEELVANPDSELGASDELAREVVKICHAGQSTSAIEDKFRADIDTLLEENLDFWLRFSTSYHQIQKFESKFKELEAEIEKAMEAKNSSVDDNISLEEAMKQNKIPTDKKLRELNTELQVWLEQNGLLQGELRSRFSSLCSIQEEIARASEEENEQFTRYQAAKFQGEVINMQQENSKVAKELETGLEHVRGLQVQVGRALSLLHQSFDLSVASKRSHHHPVGHPLRHLSTKSRIPLRTFLFGVKPKKPSLFSCMNPVYQKHHSDTRHATGLHK